MVRISPQDVAASELFDEDWYRETHLSATSRIGAVDHYLGIGFRNGCSPSPFFDLNHYAGLYPDLDFRRTNPLMHYLQVPAEQRASPHPLFDREYYRKVAGPDLPAGTDLFGHFLREGDIAGKAPHVLFDPAFYLSSNPDVVQAGLAPFRHFVRWGFAEGRNAYPLFDPQWYLSQVDDPAIATSPLIHYLTIGNALGLSPHPLFDPAWYRRTQIPEDESGMEPLLHFLTEGSAQGLDPNPLFSTLWYRQRYPDVANWNPLLHYMAHGWRERRDPHPAFSTSAYLRRHPECQIHGVNPLVHALERARPASGKPITVVPSAAEPGPRKPVAEPVAPDTGDRRFLAQILGDEAGPACASRVISYFDIIERLELDSLSSTLSRPEKLDRLTARLRELSAGFSRAEKPDVSIIVPVYNSVAYTIACVLSLMEHQSRYSYEILIGNDVSTDETKEIFESVGGIVTCVTHAQNGGFIRNCNRSALHARGKYVVLLNNDTLIIDGWLDELIAPFEEDDTVGVVGSKLLMSDGRLQEAGGILWDDASAWNFGRNADPRQPEFNYLKDADYISGASIAVPLTIWKLVGGLDERYVPAYFDDSDLAFSVRALGYRTLYQPASVIIHHEGVSHGTEVSTGIKAYQVVNKTKFLEKWADVLAAEQFPNAQEVFLARDRSRGKPHILVVDHYAPQFDKDAGSRTMFDYLSLFAKSGFQVTFWPENLFYDRRYVRALQALGCEVLYGARYVGQFAAWMAENARYFDYVLLSRAHVADKFIETVKQHGDLKVLFYGHDIASLRLKMQIDKEPSAELQRELAHVEALERKIWSLSDVVYHPADFETEFVARESPGTVSRLFPPYLFKPPVFTEARKLAVMEKPATQPAAIFVAGFRHTPNIDSAIWLVKAIWPLVLKKVPNATLYIAGSHPPPEVEALASHSINVTGYIADSVLQTLYGISHVAVAPLRYGGGIKFKVVEAMRFGLPVVTTPVGIQGLMDAHEYIRIAEDAAAFADHIVALLQNRDSAKDLAVAAVSYLEKQFSIESARALLARDIPELEVVAARSPVLKMNAPKQLVGGV